MEDFLATLLQYADYEPLQWDNEFYISISKAAELTGLSPSQIRYFEELSGGVIGRREGPRARNRVYTKRDVRLLKGVYLCKNVRPAEIAQFIRDHQEEILQRLGQVTLPQLLRREQTLAGRDVLISDLVAILLSVWREALVPGDALIRGIILGQQNEAWKTSFLQSVQDESPIDLANCLVIWSTDSQHNDSPADAILFSLQSWYLPRIEPLIFDTSGLDDTGSPFTAVLAWQPRVLGVAGEQEQLVPSIKMDEPRRQLVSMLLYSLKRVLDSVTGPSGEPVSVYSRAVLDPGGLSHGLSLLLTHCVRPYFPNCYSYVAIFAEDDRLELLDRCGEPDAGYTSRLWDSSRTLDLHKAPWWVKLASDQVVIALDQEARRRPESAGEHGSVVCIPLVRQDRVVGIFAVENTQTESGDHCLASRENIDGPGLLRYLICTAEIVADYLNRSASAHERHERSRLAYTHYETSNWHWNLYRQGGLNYTSVIEKILDWLQQVSSSPKDQVDIVVFDITKEDELAKEYKGFDIIAEILQKTSARIEAAIREDPTIANIASSRNLVLFDEPVADHIVLAALNLPTSFLHVFLERRRTMWRPANDKFIWEDKEVDVSLQVGVCTFTSLGSYQRAMAAELMKHHLWMMAQEMKGTLEHILEYDAVVVTEKVKK